MIVQKRRSLINPPAINEVARSHCWKKRIFNQSATSDTTACMGRSSTVRGHLGAGIMAVTSKSILPRPMSSVTRVAVRMVSPEKSGPANFSKRVHDQAPAPHQNGLGIVGNSIVKVGRQIASGEILAGRDTKQRPSRATCCMEGVQVSRSSAVGAQ